MTNQTPKVVVVTGASTGIGQACALHLDKLGFYVFAGVRKQADAEALRQQASSRLMPVFLDVTQNKTIISTAEAVRDFAGPAGLAGLVNNAGIAVGGPLEFLSIEALCRQIEVNVIGQIAVTQAFLPLLRLGRGRIINMGSISGRGAMPFMGPYAASKFALRALTDSLRLELRPWNIQVSLIEPGAIDTPIWEKSLSAADELANAWPPEVHDLYGQAMTTTRQTIFKAGQNAVSVDEVVGAVTHALTAKQPKTRYLVGRGTKVIALAIKLLPDRVRDWFILKQRNG
ncbi:MAG: SDR family oxidoreductase [Anaerolineae bacterium]|nr:SDR family oxidoreductase [Anaerolineae bacterium]